jgi:hypothetical protein
VEWIFLAQNRDKLWALVNTGFIKHGKFFCVRNISVRRGKYLRNAPSFLRQFLTPQVSVYLSTGVLRSQ